jgi:hypothetical protein
MSPVDQSRGHVGKAAVVSLVGVLVALVGLGLVAVALRGHKTNLGDATFTGGSTQRLAKEISERGPIIYSDVSGRKDRDMILQHLGTNPEKGWYAFLAAPVSKARDCTWRWRPETSDFVASCDPSLTAPADGEGLPQFKVSVADGRIDVDLNADARTDGSTPTTTAATSSD